MKKVNRNRDDGAYKQIFDILCSGFYPELASFDNFMKLAIPKLPNKMQKDLRKYWGIDGGINHRERISKLIVQHKKLNIADQNMYYNITRIILTLENIDYMRLFHTKVDEIIKKIAKKTTGEPDETTAVKYADLYAQTILNGPYIIFDRKFGVQRFEELELESRTFINRAWMLENEYNVIFKKFKDGELIIPAVKEWLENLDICYRVSLLKFFDIKVPDYLKEYEPENVMSVLDFRRLKEKIFSNGRWASDGFFFIARDFKNSELIEDLSSVIDMFIKKHLPIKEGTTEEFAFGTGKRNITMLSIGTGKDKIEFPYFEEAMAMRFWQQYYCKA